MSYRFFTVRGFPKSGTTWIENLLELHPEIEVRGEYYFNYITEASRKFIALDNNKQFSDVVNKSIQKLIKECLVNNLNAKNKKSIKLIGDRSPTNLEPLILENIPQIYVVRDGRDVLVSYIYHQLRAARLKKKLEIFNKDKNYFEKNPEELLNDKNYVRYMAGKWSDFIKKDIKTLNKIKKRLIKTRVCYFKYEDLHSDTEKLRNRMYRF